MKIPAIISIGEVLWDLFPDGDHFGGAPANFACHTAIRGADVTLISAVGSDQYGRAALEKLKEYQIDVSCVQIVEDAPTGTVRVTLDLQGQPTFTIHEDCAWDRLTWNDDFDMRIRAADAIYFGTLGQRSARSRATIRQAISTARDAEILRVLDVNLRSPFDEADLIRESIELASILKLSDDELAPVCSACGIILTEEREALHRLLNVGSLEMVVMTCGADGAMLVTPDQVIVQNGIPTTVVDTVGAGDSFTAAFVVGLLQRKPLAEILQHACEVAAETCSHSGGVPPIAKNSQNPFPPLKG
ncbi:MAG: carbohydrate kinase [Zavarzinella sp.]